jgi:hypothetical protein
VRLRERLNRADLGGLKLPCFAAVSLHTMRGALGQGGSGRLRAPAPGCEPERPFQELQKRGLIGP